MFTASRCDWIYKIYDFFFVHQLMRNLSILAGWLPSLVDSTVTRRNSDFLCTCKTLMFCASCQSQHRTPEYYWLYIVSCDLVWPCNVEGMPPHAQGEEVAKQEVSSLFCGFLWLQLAHGYSTAVKVLKCTQISRASGIIITINIWFLWCIDPWGGGGGGGILYMISLEVSNSHTCLILLVFTIFFLDVYNSWIALISDAQAYILVCICIWVILSSIAPPPPPQYLSMPVTPPPPPHCGLCCVLILNFLFDMDSDLPVWLLHLHNVVTVRCTICAM